MIEKIEKTLRLRWIECELNRNSKRKNIFDIHTQYKTDSLCTIPDHLLQKICSTLNSPLAGVASNLFKAWCQTFWWRLHPSKHETHNTGYMKHAEGITSAKSNTIQQYPASIQFGLPRAKVYAGRSKTLQCCAVFCVFTLAHKAPVLQASKLLWWVPVPLRHFVPELNLLGVV